MLLCQCVIACEMLWRQNIVFIVIDVLDYDASDDAGHTDSLEKMLLSFICVFVVCDAHIIQIHPSFPTEMKWRCLLLIACSCVAQFGVFMHQMWKCSARRVIVIMIQSGCLCVARSDEVDVDGFLMYLIWYSWSVLGSF